MTCFRPAALGAALALVAASAPAPAGAETFVGSNVDTRVTLAFRVDEQAAQAWLPEGWTLAPFSQGPLAGSNLLVIFIDRHLSLGPEGEPADSPVYRGIALVSPAKRDDETRFYVTRVYITDAAVDPYKNSTKAAITRRAVSEGSGNDGAAGHEEWTAEAEAGGSLSFRLDHAAATPGWSEREARPYSSVEPDFHRIYRYQQLAALLRSAPADIDLVNNVAFETSIEELAPMFDGNEQLVAIVKIPWYLRHTYLP